MRWLWLLDILWIKRLTVDVLAGREELLFRGISSQGISAGFSQ
jgi:hypothetical protein